MDRSIQGIKLSAVWTTGTRTVDLRILGHIKAVCAADHLAMIFFILINLPACDLPLCSLSKTVGKMVEYDLMFFSHKSIDCLWLAWQLLILCYGVAFRLKLYVPCVDGCLFAENLSVCCQTSQWVVSWSVSVRAGLVIRCPTGELTSGNRLKHE